ncbi:ABC transporter ATP-binding protein [Paenibacillus alkaliterrae]|uniref:ABC transporter ATP-binding protein n=1 Tax=Paenibacillus alkaliterrae TaxID=320909 RepID=UPI001F4845A8|nr:ABC transporter ATP-binding protein [Paenibacillus alkaliterrae]MCF2940975.1 ABC transporter ATP-binding protein [Paenibacillus alkaliterrae]
MTYFELSDISFRFAEGKGDVLHNFSMRLNKGEVVGVLGQSGGGKSTLLRIIAGLEVPNSGNISINGRTLVDRKQFVLPEKRGIGMIFQDYALFPHLTVAQNILFGLHRLSRKERLQRLEEMLELIQLQDFRKRFPHELSGGQQQRVAFARSLAPEPELLLMDEPFSSLDADLKHSIREELKRMLRTANMTCILVTHDKEDAAVICDRVVHIANIGHALNINPKFVSNSTR